jgi:hypothetical protein
VAQDQSIFLVREVVGKLLTGRANVNVLLRHVAEILLAEAAFRLRFRCLRRPMRASFLVLALLLDPAAVLLLLAAI